MSSWWPSSGRYSPFASYTARGPPQVTQDDFTYLDSERRPQGHHQNSTQSGAVRNDNYGFPPSNSTRHTIHPDLDLDPDILVLKHKGTTYPLHFPAFSIAESLKIGELRRQAAKETKCDDPRRVKLLYKGRSLRDDGKQCREEGLKQNSELMCVVSIDPSTPTSGRRDGGDESSSSASEAAIANGVDAVPRRPQEKRKKHRGPGGKKTRTGRERAERDLRFDDESPRDPPPSSLYPPNGGGVGGSSTDRAPSHDRHIDVLPPSSSTSSAPPPPTTTTTTTTTTASTAGPPPKNPTTPSEIVHAISNDFTTNFLPKVHHLLEHPPKANKERDFESKKLSEGILTQVLFKLDGVQTDDEGVKARRKECVKMANFWSAELDRLQKR